MTGPTRGTKWRYVFAILLLAGGAGSVAWLRHTPSPEAAMQAAAPDIAEAASQALPPPPVVAMPAPTPRERSRFDPAAFAKDLDAQMDEAMRRRYSPPPRLADVQARADSGDVPAMVELGRMLQRCLDALRDPDALKLESQYAEQLERQARLGHPASPARSGSIEQDYREDVERHRDCTAAGAERVEGFHLWLERAARAGSVDAMVTYTELALSGFHTDQELIADLDEVIRRRDLARAFGLSAIAAGNAHALNLVASGHAWLPGEVTQHAMGGVGSLGTTGLFPSSPHLAAAYWYANKLVMAGHFGSRLDGTFETLWHSPENSTFPPLNDTEWQAAAATGREIYLRWFVGPENPPEPPPR